MTAENLEQLKLELTQYDVHVSASSNTYEALLQALDIYINDLIVNHFHHFISLLYRLDIPEDNLRQYLRDNEGEQASLQIAKMIIERQLQKIEARKSFSNNDPISDEERW